MSADEDSVAEHLSKIRNTEIQLRQHNVPSELVDGFAQAIFSLTPSTEVEKAILFSPLANHLASRLDEQAASDTSVRYGKALPPSIIATATMEMIDNLGGSISMVPSLREILIQLLELKSYTNKQSRQDTARWAAIFILSLKPETGVNKLSRFVGVSKSTVSRWRNDADFIHQLDEMTIRTAEPMWQETIKLAIIGATEGDEEVKTHIGI